MRRTISSLLIVVPAVLLGIAACGGSAFDGSSPGASGTAAGNGGTGATAGSSYGAAGQSSGGAVSYAGTGNIGGGGGGGTGGVDMTACTSNSECELVSVGCCGSCGASTVSSFAAINASYDDQYGKRCGAVACAPCLPMPFDPNAASFYFVPTCRAGHCAVVDLRATAITACQLPADCVLRGGTACCSGCGGQPVALNGKTESALESLVCDSEPVACAGCISTPSDYTVGCSAGRCTVDTLSCTAAHPCPD